MDLLGREARCAVLPLQILSTSGRGDEMTYISHRYLRKDGSKMTAKENLAVLNNAWLVKREVDEARRMATDPLVTEKEAEKFLKQLEESATSAYYEWRNYQ